MVLPKTIWVDNSSANLHAPLDSAFPHYLRMIEKETQHFLRCIRPLSVRIGSRRAASGPGVAGAADIPMLQDLAFAVGVSRAGIPMPSRNLPAMHLLSRLCRSDGMFDNVGARRVVSAA
jgi:hypothetical protein